MKDPSGAIYAAFNTKLATLAYSGKTVPVYSSRAEVKKADYVLLDTLSFEDRIDETHFASDCEMRIEVRCGPYMQQGHWDRVFGISSALFQAVIKQSFSLSGFTMGVEPYVISSRNYEEREQDEQGIYQVKELIIGFHVEEN